MSRLWKKGRFRSYPVLNDADIKIFAIEYEEKPCWLAIGTPESRKSHTSLELGKEKIGLEREVEKSNFFWEHFINPKNLPDFMTLDQAKIFMQGAIASSSGSATVFTSSSEPIVYEDNATIENVLSSYNIPQQKIEGAKDLSAKFFVRNIKIELEYPNIFSGSKKYPVWEPIFTFINLLEKSTTIYKAELRANNDDIITINDSIKIELNISSVEKKRIQFYLNKPIEDLKYIKGFIIFKHTYGDIPIDVDYEINGIVNISI